MTAQNLKNFNEDTATLEDMVELLAFGEAFRATYEKFTDVPEWVDTSIASVRRAIRSKVDDQIDRQLREARGLLESLRTAEEKRNAIKERIASLEAKRAASN